jgi:hypothetical protein
MKTILRMNWRERATTGPSGNYWQSDQKNQANTQPIKSGRNLAYAGQPNNRSRRLWRGLIAFFGIPQLEALIDALGQVLPASKAATVVGTLATDPVISDPI